MLTLPFLLDICIPLRLVLSHTDRLYFALWNDSTLYYFASEGDCERFFDGDQSTDEVLGQIDLDGIQTVSAMAEAGLPHTGVNLKTHFGGWTLCPEPDESGQDSFPEWLKTLSNLVG